MIRSVFASIYCSAAEVLPVSLPRSGGNPEDSSDDEQDELIEGQDAATIDHLKAELFSAQQASSKASPAAQQPELLSSQHLECEQYLHRAIEKIQSLYKTIAEEVRSMANMLRRIIYLNISYCDVGCL